MYRAPDLATEGGAPQPAETRIALDGQAYTHQQYVDFYHGNAQRYWEASQLAVNAYGGPQPVAAAIEEGTIQRQQMTATLLSSP